MPFLLRPDGCRLYHELHGSPDAEAVVLLEGMGGDIPGWRRNIPTLSAELQDGTTLEATDAALTAGRIALEAPDAPILVSEVTVQPRAPRRASSSSGER